MVGASMQGIFQYGIARWNGFPAVQTKRRTTTGGPDVHVRVHVHALGIAINSGYNLAISSGYIAHSLLRRGSRRYYLHYHFTRVNFLEKGTFYEILTDKKTRIVSNTS